MHVLAHYLTEGLEDHTDKPATPEEGDVVIQEGKTPTKGFDTAMSTADVDTGKPATATLSAPSDDTDDKKHEHPDDHLDVVVSKEDNHDDDDSNKEKDTPTDGHGDPNDNVDTGKPAVAAIPPKESADEESVTKSDDGITADDQGAGHHNVSDGKDVMNEGGSKPTDSVTVEKGGDGKPDIKPSDQGTSVEKGGDPGDNIAAKVEKASVAVEDFKRIGASLEGWQVLIGHALEHKDGLERQTAQAIRLGLEAIDESFGGEQVVPGLEAFGGTSSRRHATLQLRNSLKEVQGRITFALSNAQSVLDHYRV